MGATVTFTDTSTGSPTAWAWNFGDGATSTVQDPVHIYAADGTYYVTLTAYISASDYDTTAQFIAINTVIDLVLEYV